MTTTETLKSISKMLDSAKIKNFVDVKSLIKNGNEEMVEILFPRYTDADKAIALLAKCGFELSERESNKHINAYYKFKIELYLKAN